MSAIDSTVARERLREAAAKAATVPTYDDEGKPSGEVDALELARDLLNLPTLLRVVQRGDEQALFELELEGARPIVLGSIDDFESPTKVRRAVTERRIGAPPKPARIKKEWGRLSEALHLIVELVESDATPAQVTLGWLREYVDRRGAELRDLDDDGDRELSVTGSSLVGGVEPFWTEDGTLHLFLSDFELFLRSNRQNVSTTDLSARLDRIGFERFELKQRHSERGQRRRSRKYKRSAPGFRDALDT